MECVRKVLQKLREHDLFLKVSKCTFCKEQVKFLGMTVLGKGISMSEDKLKAISDWKPPTRVKGVRSFLDLANFYRRFINDFAKITKPLTSLTCKDVPFIWGVDQQLAFNTLKRQFTTAPILVFPDPTVSMCVETDASAFAVGATLIIHQP